jgi:formyltetrahydrofolate deformylase
MLTAGQGRARFAHIVRIFASVQGQPGKTGEKPPCKSNPKYKLRSTLGQFECWFDAALPFGTAAHFATMSAPSWSDSLKNSAALLIQCPDQKGLDATIADFIFRHDGNILHFEQHQAGEERFYLARVEWDLSGFSLPLDEFKKQFAPVAEKFVMQWRVAHSSYRPRVAIFVSKHDHCLLDLLYRQRNGELACDVPLIISNHDHARRHAEFHNTPYQFIPVSKESKESAEIAQRELLTKHQIDLIVLARYMQILSPQFISQYPQRIINIHHSFLPAFVGARPHQQAYDRGVKILGATAHYVTEVLDDGPIIEQGVVRISHKDDLDDLVEKGRDLEKVVLSRAVRWHIENRILLYANRTVIFE